MNKYESCIDLLNKQICLTQVQDNFNFCEKIFSKENRFTQTIYFLTHICSTMPVLT